MDENPQKIPVNYLYFGAFFVLLGLMSASSVLLKEYFIGSRIFFLLYALGQALLEVGAFVYLGSLIERFLGRRFFWAFIGLTFFLAIFHVIDFLVDRVLDLSAWNTLGFVLGESLHDFIYLLDASGVPLWAWGCIFSLLACLPLLGMALYKGSDFVAKKRPLLVPSELFLQMFVCIPVALFLWDCSASRVIHPDAYAALVRSLPWKSTFLQPKNVMITPPGALLGFSSEESVQKAIEEVEAVPSYRPNIYLIVVESFRESFITKETAPHLSKFRDQHTFSPSTVSNANNTVNSWFSIFHSQFSIHWDHYRKANWSMGSPALNLLKKWGYQIRVYSSAELGYYGMNELIFGKEQHLIDSYQAFHHMPPVYAWETDAEALTAMQKDLNAHEELQQGQVFILFWDSTHFDYSFPKEKPQKFNPFAKSLSYFKIFQTKQSIEEIKNSYRNAVHYIDSLFESFWENLPNKEEALVVVAGDHGEEFFEQGHLFHNSHLVEEQIRIPLYFKFGKALPKIEKPIVSQVDIFPSLIDYLSGSVPTFLQGESLFRPSKWPFAMISRFNGGRTPYEFSFHNGKSQVVARFQNIKNITPHQPLQIRSLWNCKNNDICECKQSVESWIQEEFGGAFERLFPED